MPPQGGRKHPHQEFIQIDTTNVLFIVGGAFAGLEKIIESRAGAKGIGFGATIRSKRELEAKDQFQDVMPEDLVKFGMIPEFIGRLPVITSVHNLDREALLQILVEPRNALVKQYQRLFELDGVELDFEREALEAIADQAILRQTGARGLRAIMEEVLHVGDVRGPVPQGRGPRRHHRGRRPLATSTRPWSRATRADGDRASRRRRNGSGTQRAPSNAEGPRSTDRAPLVRLCRSAASGLDATSLRSLAASVGRVLRRAALAVVMRGDVDRHHVRRPCCSRPRCRSAC